MAQIKFKAKVQKVQRISRPDGDKIEFVYVEILKIPTLTRSHCDMAAFRRHPKYTHFANSDFFPGMLARIKQDKGGTLGELKLDQLPAGVSVDTSGFLAEVTIEV